MSQLFSKKIHLKLSNTRITPEEITGSEMSGKLIAIEYCLNKHRDKRQCELIPVSAFDTPADAMRFIGRFCRVE